jgi:hypothetical protein
MQSQHVQQLIASHHTLPEQSIFSTVLAAQALDAAGRRVAGIS